MNDALQRLSAEAVALHQQGREAEAERLYFQILAAAPGDFTACYMLGAIRFRQGRADEALALLARAAAVNPAEPGPLMLKGLVQQQIGQPEAALASFDQALRVQPNAVEALVNRGNVLNDLGRHAEAVASHDRALALKPGFALALYNRGVALKALGRAEDALESFDRALAAQPNYPAALNNRGSVLRELQQYEAALENFDRALAIDPGNAQALYNRGTALQDLKRYTEALGAFEQALGKMPNFVPALNNHAVVLHALNLHGQALGAFDRALAIQPDNAAVLSNRGNTLRSMKRLEEALVSIDRALAIQPDYADALNNRGNTLRELKRLDEALESANRALALEPDNLVAYSNRGVIFLDMKRPAEALADFDRVLAVHPDSGTVLFNRGLALKDLGQPDAALASYDKAIAAEPGFADAYVNRGDVLRDMAMPDEALKSYETALSIAPRSAAAMMGCGAALQVMRRFEEALESYNRALAHAPDDMDAFFNRGHLLGTELHRFEAGLADLEKVAWFDPERDYLKGDIVHLKMHCADWRGIEAEFAQLDEGVRAGKKIVRPFVYQAISQSAADLMKASQIYAQDRYPGAASSRQSPRGVHARLRVGYVSGDFREQATAFLTAGLYEQHDRNSFEIVAFDAGWNDQSATRRRLEASFDGWIDIAGLSDAAAAARIAAEEIDILVNLNGYFGAERMGVFARRPAPIQVNYLGFPATLGADYIDYILADRIVIPQAEQDFYAEKVVYLPDSYQVNDARRAIAQDVPSRADCGLPEKGFVFCNFNNIYKLTPDWFTGWMQILKQAENSVLWLLESNGAFAGRLRQEAVRHGVAAERLVFAKPLLPERHLARMKQADLFLDGLPYNAHTTAADSLWAGVPLLTCLGKTFPGRVAASLLNAVGLPELVTQSPQAYQALALKLAADPAVLMALRDRLAQNRQTCALFDTARFCRHLEAAFSTMWDIQRRGEAARGFAVEA